MYPFGSGFSLFSPFFSPRSFHPWIFPPYAVGDATFSVSERDSLGRPFLERLFLLYQVAFRCLQQVFSLASYRIRKF